MSPQLLLTGRGRPVGSGGGEGHCLECCICVLCFFPNKTPQEIRFARRKFLSCWSSSRRRLGTAVWPNQSMELAVAAAEGFLAAMLTIGEGEMAPASTHLACMHTIHNMTGLMPAVACALLTAYLYVATCIGIDRITPACSRSRHSTFYVRFGGLWHGAICVLFACCQGS